MPKPPYMEIWKSGNMTIFTHEDGDGGRYSVNSAWSVYDLEQHCKAHGFTEEERRREPQGTIIWTYTKPVEVK